MWAEQLGIDLDRCQEHPVRTGNGMACHYEHSEPMTFTVRDVGIKIPVRANFGQVGIPILGRLDPAPKPDAS